MPQSGHASIARDTPEGLALARMLRESNLHPSFAKQKSSKLDLRNLPLTLSWFLLVDYLVMMVIESETFKSPEFKDIQVVTGRGLGSGPDGSVLKTEATQFLRQYSGPETSPVEGYEGCFLIKQSSLQRWVETRKVSAVLSSSSPTLAREAHNHGRSISKSSSVIVAEN